VAPYLTTGFFIDGNDGFRRRKGRMKTLWIASMTVTFLLGTGVVIVMYVLGKMFLSYARSGR